MCKTFYRGYSRKTFTESTNLEKFMSSKTHFSNQFKLNITKVKVIFKTCIWYIVPRKKSHTTQISYLWSLYTRCIGIKFILDTILTIPEALGVFLEFFDRVANSPLQRTLLSLPSFTLQHVLSLYPFKHDYCNLLT